ncbi:MAG TPA: oxidoreductase [Firmicutes bacterium]|jgi:predicted dehydrogenase/threonine dehydrogenase-like Zn-dependent dehydrogenase|nr:oxidoreductase [Bacillota bacterium]
MKQVTQDFRSGQLRVEDVPSPLLKPVGVIVQTTHSLISVGTEKAVIGFASQNLAAKARSRPDLVKQVIRKVRTDGLVSTYRTSMSRLDTPLALGYSSAGEVSEVGSAVSGMAAGDRVACCGSGYASHAELVYVPRNLAVRIPDEVSSEDAAFATVGSIALQGIRLADLRLGEKVAIIGLGLLGLLAVQFVKAAGCLAIGTDLDSRRVSLALELGADAAAVTDPDAFRELVMNMTSGYGADAVIITAATRSSAPTVLAGEVSRIKGRVVAIGDVGMNIPRRVYYPKELEYKVSMSYGPGRYDPQYEEHGIDYPYPYVRFTEQRNIETFLSLVKQGKVTPGKLITHRFPIEDATRAYDLIQSEEGRKCLGVVFTYPETVPESRRIDLVHPGASHVAPTSCLGIGAIGAGNYAKLMLLPHLSRMRDVKLTGVVTSTGISGKHTAGKVGFGFCTTDVEELLSDKQTNTVVIATRHDTHASLAIRALRVGKNVFVEKPLALNEDELRGIASAAHDSGKLLMVGFNRRFSPTAVEARMAFASHQGPLSMIYRVNAGSIPAEHWTQDPAEGGGRIVGEACHFIDLMQYLCDSPPIAVYALAGAKGDSAVDDNVAVTVQFDNGSIGTLAYFTTGDRAIPKEHVEVYGGGKTAIIEDFRRVQIASGGNVRAVRSRGQDKGQSSMLDAFVQAIHSGGPWPIPLDQLVATTLTSFRVLDSIRTREVIPVKWAE